MANNSNVVVIVVDGYRIGALYAPRLHERGYQCVHVQSHDPASLNPHFVATHNPNDYLVNISYTSDFTELLQVLKNYQVKRVITGFECGVELTDKLNYALGLPGNDLHLSQARRNKYLMIEAVKSHNLATVKHFISDSLQAIIDWAQKINQWPLVTKPATAGGTEGVVFCYSIPEIITAFNQVVGKRAAFGVTIKELLVQTYLDGTEYVINSVSLNGKHYLSDLWVYHKVHIAQASLIYDCVRLLPYTNKHRELLLKYTFQVLDALGIKQGPAHTEIMLTKNGPILVECGARAMGAISPDAINLAIGRNQVDLTLDAYLEPETFLTKINHPYRINNYLLVKFLISPVAGVIDHVDYLPQIKQLPSFYTMDLDLHPGSLIYKTVDVPTAPGIVNLLHPNEEAVNKDYAKICKWEKEMFVVEDESAELMLHRLLVLIIINAREHESALE